MVGQCAFHNDSSHLHVFDFLAKFPFSCYLRVFDLLGILHNLALIYSVAENEVCFERLCTP